MTQTNPQQNPQPAQPRTIGNLTEADLNYGFWEEFSYRLPVLTDTQWENARILWADLVDPDVFGPRFAAYHAVAKTLGLDIHNLPDQYDEN